MNDVWDSHYAKIQVVFRQNKVSEIIVKFEIKETGHFGKLHFLSILAWDCGII